MLKPLKMPQLALGTEEVVCGEWKVAPGDSFGAGEPLLEIETDKAIMEVEAPFDGVLLDQRCAVGDTVVVGAVIAYAAEPGADADAARADLERLDEQDEERAGPAVALQPDKVEVAVADAPPPGADPDGSFLTVEHGALAGIPLGRPQAEPGPPAPVGAVLDSREAAGPAQERLLSRRRQAIGRRMAVATSIPAFVVHREVSATPGRESVSAARAGGQRVTFTDVLLQTCAVAAKAQPIANSWLLDGQLLEFEHVNVALAVDSPDGVIAPVIRQVELLDLAEIAEARNDLVTRARTGKIDARELVGATLTLSNVAGLGAHAITPVLTAPQTVAVGVGTSRSSAVGDVITVTFVGDHRALDGADGARFLAAFDHAMQSLPTFH